MDTTEFDFGSVHHTASLSPFGADGYCRNRDRYAGCIRARIELHTMLVALEEDTREGPHRNADAQISIGEGDGGGCCGAVESESEETAATSIPTTTTRLRDRHAIFPTARAHGNAHVTT